MNKTIHSSPVVVSWSCTSQFQQDSYPKHHAKNYIFINSYVQYNTIKQSFWEGIVFDQPFCEKGCWSTENEIEQMPQMRGLYLKNLQREKGCERMRRVQGLSLPKHACAIGLGPGEDDAKAPQKNKRRRKRRQYKGKYSPAAPGRTGRQRDEAVL